MRLRNGMTSVVGTALAVVAAGSLVLFSLVLQRSAFDATAPPPIEAKAPQSNNGTTTVQVPGYEQDTSSDRVGGPTDAGSGESGGPGPLSPETGDLLSPFPSDDVGGDEPLVASVDPPPAPGSSGDGDNPIFEGGTGDGPGVISGSDGPSFSNGGPQATINNDPNTPGKPGKDPLGGKDGPKNVNPPHGPKPPGDSKGDDEGSKPDSPGKVNDHAKPGNAPNIKGDLPVNKPGDHGKDEGSKDKGSKDEGSKDEGSKDKGSKDKGSKDKGDHKSSKPDKPAKDSKPDKPSKPAKDSKPPKAHQPKPPEPKDDDDDDDDDNRNRQDSNDSGSSKSDSSGD